MAANDHLQVEVEETEDVRKVTVTFAPAVVIEEVVSDFRRV